MELLDKEKLLKFMKARQSKLFDMYQRDFEGDPSKIYAQYWELKYWVENVERNTFDFKE